MPTRSSPPSAVDHHERVLLFQRLWQTVKAQAEALEHDSRPGVDSFVGLREWDDSREIFVRLGRVAGDHTHVVAMTITPGVDDHDLVFRVNTIQVVDGETRVVPPERLLVTYERAGDRFRIEGAASAADMAAFFVDRAEAMLRKL